MNESTTPGPGTTAEPGATAGPPAADDAPAGTPTPHVERATFLGERVADWQATFHAPAEVGAA
ncbi:hypothetical protein AB0G92_35095, partial [Streptomyces californicus]